MKYLCFFVLMIIFSGCKSNVGNKPAKSDASLTREEIEATLFVVPGTKIAIKDTLLIVDTLKRTDDSVFSYGSILRLPKVIAGERGFTELNQKIMKDFAEITSSIQSNGHPDQNQFRKIAYNVYVTDSIVSIVVSDTQAYYLAEGNTRYKVYHFNSNSNQLVNTDGFFAAFGLSQMPILSAFAEQCTMPPDHSEPLFEASWFEQVKWKNINDLKLFIDNDKKIVIIYPVAENGIEATQKLESH